MSFYHKDILTPSEKRRNLIEGQGMRESPASQIRSLDEAIGKLLRGGGTIMILRITEVAWKKKSPGSG